MNNRSIQLNFDTEGNQNIDFQIDGSPQKAHHTWFRGENCNFNPAAENMYLLSDIEKHVLKGFVPEAPCMTGDTKVVAFGSCFAEHITNYLAQRNYNVLTKKGGEVNIQYKWLKARSVCGEFPGKIIKNIEKERRLFLKKDIHTLKKKKREKDVRLVWHVIEEAVRQKKGTGRRSRLESLVRG